MTRTAFCTIASVLLVATSGFAENKSLAGTWQFDKAQSNLGSDPAPKSLTIDVMKDSPELLSWRVRGTDDKGKSFSYSWSGPEDGSMHSIMQDGKEIGKESAKKDSDSALLRHGEDPSDGSSFDARSTISNDGKTMTDEITLKSKDGKETKQKYVYHRSPAKVSSQVY